MKKEIVEVKKNELMIPEEDMSFGMENILSTDIKVPKILLVQQMSKMATDDKIQARPGEIRESFEGIKLGDGKNPCQIIIFYCTNTWTVKKEKNGKMEFYDIQDRGGSDVKREYSVMDADGNAMTNHRTLNIFAIVKGGNLAVPYMVSFMNSSFKYAAQPFLNKSQLLKATKKSSAHIVWNLGSKVEENEKGKFFAFTLEAAKDDKGSDIPSTQEELAAAYSQYKLITSHLNSGGKIDMSDADDAEVVQTNKTTAQSTEDVPF